MVANRAASGSPTGSTPRSLAAARAGVLLADRPLILISSVLDSVMNAVPQAPAKRPFPIAAGHCEGFAARRCFSLADITEVVTLYG
jgi:hypothetical protein